jgi:hypothetical protein
VTVLEVLEPASKNWVEAGDDGFQAVAIVSLREAADVVLDLHEAFSAWPLLVAFEVVAEEVETSGLGCARRPPRRPVICAETERALGADEETYSCTLTIPDDAIALLLRAYRRKAPAFYSAALGSAGAISSALMVVLMRIP